MTAELVRVALHAPPGACPPRIGWSRLGIKGLGFRKNFSGTLADFAMLARSGRILHVSLENDRTEAIDVLLVVSVQKQNGVVKS